MIRIGLLGGPGCGKSTQCAHFFSKLKEASIQSEQVQEWVREAINKGQLPPNNPWAQWWIYTEQKEKEDCIPAAIDYMVTDSPTILSYVYALKYATRPNDNSLLLKMYEYFLKDLTRYDYLFVCKREKAYIQDGTRTQTIEDAKELDELLLNLLKAHGVNCFEISGTVEERTTLMRTVIGI